jgi:spore coat protein A
MARGRVYAIGQSAPLKKFIQRLPGAGPSGIPIASPDVNSYRGSDYYRLFMGEYAQLLHPDLPNATKLWGYADATNGTPVFRHLGPLVVAQSGRPVRMTFTNQLPPVHPLPVDTSLDGLREGQPHNRATVHLHGGNVPWISDGGPHSWYTPGGVYGAAAISAPDMPRPARGSFNAFYPNSQSARLMWFHDHAIGTTRLSAYAGLAGAYILRDSVEANLIASGAIPSREIPIIIQDKAFKQVADQWGLPGDLNYPSVYDPAIWELAPGGQAPPVPSCIPEFFGDTMLVNGVVYPYADVEPRRYRLRILNACNARFCSLRLVYAQGPGFPDDAEPNVNSPGPEFVQIGTEGGFLPAPVTLDGRKAARLLLAPAERADIIVDFSQVTPGSRLILYNDAPAPFPMGDPATDYYNLRQTNSVVTQAGFGPNTRTLLQFRVGQRVGAQDATGPLTLAMDPAPLVPPGLMQLPPGVTVRNLTLNESFDGYGRLTQLLGTNVPSSPGSFSRGYRDRPTEVTTPGAVEAWRLFNLTADTHPIHFHLANAQVVSRQAFDVRRFNGTPSFLGQPQPPDGNEMGWKETIRMNPGECTTVIMKFDLPPVPFIVPPSPRLMMEYGIVGAEYVWHCHILEHEEHDMMRPLVLRT